MQNNPQCYAGTEKMLKYKAVADKTRFDYY